MNKNTTGCIFVVYWRRKMLCSFCERSFRVRDNPFDNKTSWVTTKRVHSDSEIKHSMETRIIRCHSKFIHFWNVRKRMTAMCCRVIPQNGKIKFASSSNEMLIMSKLYSLLVLLLSSPLHVQHGRRSEAFEQIWIPSTLWFFFLPS